MSHSKKFKSLKSNPDLFNKAFEVALKALGDEGYDEDSISVDYKKYFMTNGNVLASQATPRDLLEIEFKHLVSVLIIKKTNPDFLGKANDYGNYEAETFAIKSIASRMPEIDNNMKPAESAEVAMIIYNKVSNFLDKELGTTNKNIKM